MNTNRTYKGNKITAKNTIGWKLQKNTSTECTD